MKNFPTALFRRGFRRLPARFRTWRRNSFSAGFYSSLVPLILATNLTVALLAAGIGHHQAAGISEANHTATMKALAFAVAAPLNQKRYAETRRIVRDFPKPESFEHILLVDSKGQTIDSAGNPSAQAETTRVPVTLESGGVTQQVGTLTVAYTCTSSLITALVIFVVSLLTTLLTSLIVYGVTTRLTTRRVVRPLNLLASAISEAGGTGEKVTIKDRFDGEVRAVANAFNMLQRRLARDEANLVAKNDRLYRRATTDPLTGLLNRTGFETQAQKCLRTAAETGHGAILMFVDLNRFKVINDTFGHGIGDAVLKKVGQRIVAGMPTDSLVARLSGDEFVVLVTSAAKEEWSLTDLGARLAEGVIAAIGAEFDVDGHRFQTGCQCRLCRQQRRL